MTAPAVPCAPLRASWIRKIEVTTVPGVTVPGPCWLWHGARTNGYGRVQVDGSLKYLHRVSYERLVGPIPSGLHTDHLCRQRACCAPYHLEPVTCLVNVRRGMGNGSAAHCPQGHEYAGDNLRVWTDKRGYTRRYCRTCQSDTAARWRSDRKKRQAATWDKYLTPEEMAVAS